MQNVCFYLLNRYNRRTSPILLGKSTKITYNLKNVRVFFFLFHFFVVILSLEL